MCNSWAHPIPSTISIFTNVPYQSISCCVYLPSTAGQENPPYFPGVPHEGARVSRKMVGTMGEGYHPSVRHMPYKVEPPRDTSPELREPGYHRKRRRRTNFTQGQVCLFFNLFLEIGISVYPFMQNVVWLIRYFWKNIHIHPNKRTNRVGYR